MIYFNFQSERFQVDYLAFNLQTNDFRKIQETAEYLSDYFQCNSVFIDEKDSTRNQILVKKSKNLYKVQYRIPAIKYWNGTQIKFSGKNAQIFYEKLKLTPLNWNLLDLDYTTLSRIDLCYDRRIKPSDREESLESFFQAIEAKNTKSKRKESIIRIQHRKGSQLLRVYIRPDNRVIRFELELKDYFAKKVQSLLFLGQFQRLEELLVRQFYRLAVSTLPMKSCYTDWLLQSFRKIRETEKLVYPFSTSYLTGSYIQSLEKEEFLYRLLQLLNYLKKFEDFVTIRGEDDQGEIVIIRGEVFRFVSFPVTHFAEFTGISKTNYYKSRKLRDFLNSLQKLPPLVEYFSDGGFRSFLAFPFLELIRRESWYVEFAIAEKFYCYNYPFYLPESFLHYHDIYDLRVKLLFLKSFAVLEVEKELPVEEFLEQFTLSNKKNRQLRESILKLLQQAQDLKLIQPRFDLFTKKGKLESVEKLTLRSLTKSKLIYFWENLSQK